MKIQVRVAEGAEDCKDIFALLCEMHRENGIYPMEPGRVARTLDALVDSGRVLVATEDGLIVGSLALHEQGSWYTEDRFLHDTWFYVHPDCRKSRAAVALLDAAKAKAREEGLDLYITIHSPVDLERKMKFMHRRGFDLAAAHFQMRN